jgi:hypothetical protein
MPMLRRLLNIASIVCLVLCVALMGMWVRSYWWTDNLHFKPSGTFLVDGASSSGRVAIRAISSTTINPNEGWFTFIPPSPVGNWRSDLAKMDRRFSTVAGFGLVRDRNVFTIMVPYWFVVLIVGALSFAPWPRVNHRFSLRAMLIAMTLVAIVLGLIAWLDRAWLEK